MILERIVIKNFRSIDYLEVPIHEINGSKTFSLLGINESGKSNLLSAIHLFEELTINFPADYHDESKDVEIIFHYRLLKSDKDIFVREIKKDFYFPDYLKRTITFDKVQIRTIFPVTGEKKIIETIDFNQTIFDDYTKANTNEIRLKKTQKESNFDLKEIIKSNLSAHFWDYSHKIIFWKSTPEFLILDEIDLEEFAANPRKVSVPLLNCFKLIDVTAIKATINKLNSSVEINNLQNKLSDTLTAYINNIWPEHKIKVNFQINNNKISLLIEDVGVKYSAKTTGQRSDGFKQFISFLLTLSAENHKSELSNTLLLIDEPETHLHPPAQINLLNELIKITSNSKNNIAFFATHSNYMIDKQNIDRCFKVIKRDNYYTSLKRIQKKESTYSEVNFEVFEILTNDYHNELYGYLEDVDKLKLTNIGKTKMWLNEKTGKEESVSLPTYIRHSIHHPENTRNKKFTDVELKKSIMLLRKLKYE
jgi:predicted ATP-dependent endonuclease of OLD family